VTCYTNYLAQHWNPDRGFGFIKPPRGGGENVFCHFSAITDGDVLRKGDPIEYELEFDNRTGKYRAVNVTGGRRDGLAEQPELTAEEVQQGTFEAGFTLISWNIDGLADDEIILRTQVAMRELLALAPTLICLQEVVPETVETIEGMLGGRYLDVECFDLETVVTWTVRGLVEAHVEAARLRAPASASLEELLSAALAAAAAALSARAGEAASTARAGAALPPPRPSS